MPVDLIISLLYKYYCLDMDREVDFDFDEEELNINAMNEDINDEVIQEMGMTEKLDIRKQLNEEIVKKFADEEEPLEVALKLRLSIVELLKLDYKKFVSISIY